MTDRAGPDATANPAGTPATNSPKRTSDRVEAIHNLRGVASVMVLADHLLGSPYISAPGAAALWSRVGDCGVIMFFFISGFILPYSMWRSGYVLGDFPRFIARRVVRVDPPYLATIGLTLILFVLLGAMKHTPYRVDGYQLLAHIAYLAPLVHKEWLLSVFWSLCTEFQFYLAIGLIYPILRRYPVPIALVCALALWLYVPGYFPADPLPLGKREVIFAHLPLFMAGMATFLYRGKTIRLPAFAAAIAISVLALFFKTPLDTSIVALVTIGIVLFSRFRNRILGFFGNISYSLYLVHLLVVITVVPLGHERGLSAPVLAVLGAAVAIGAATLLYIFVEKPALALAKKIKSRGGRAPSAAVLADTPGP